ncbi:MAG: glycosyltransferase [Bacteroidota bacterium]|nr:glycosyltransferase [Bacteroidota bacterium]
MILVFSFLGLYILLIALIIIYSGKKNGVIYHSNEVLTKVSVVVAARNEEDNILTLLGCLLNQKYPKEKYEIIIVNDYSDDNTENLLKGYGQQIKYINVCDSIEQTGGKKNAIAYGVSQATGELIITTDADCILNPTHISVIEKLYRSTDAKFISAPVILYHIGNPILSRLLHHFQVVEFGSLIVAGNALINMRKPLLCNGANMAYPKKVFEEVNGYAGNEQIPSGDDEFLLKKIAAKYPNDIHFLPDKEAAVHTPAMATLSELVQQRIRWASKHKNYNSLNKAILWLIFIANFMLYATLLLPENPVYFFTRYLIYKILVDACLTSLYLRYKISIKTFIYLPLIELLYPIYLVYIGIAANFLKYEWKGRVQKA